MALVFESFQCRVICREAIVQFDSARYVVYVPSGPGPTSESQS